MFAELRQPRSLALLLIAFVSCSLLGCEDGDGMPNPGLSGDARTTTSTTTAAPMYEVEGALTMDVTEDPEAILADADAKKVFEDSARETIAEEAGVDSEMVDIISIGVVDESGAGRRLVGEKYLQVDYSIMVESETKATETKNAVDIMNTNKEAVKEKMNKKMERKVNALPAERKKAMLKKVKALAVKDVKKVKAPEVKKCGKRCQKSTTTSTTRPSTTSAFLSTSGPTPSPPTPSPPGPTNLPTYARSKELDAQFLMQASFGPTRSTIAALGRTTYQQWINDQLNLPVESHRVYYRERANARHNDTWQIGMPRSRCARGSRWHGYALTMGDTKSTFNVARNISVKNNQVFVDGVFRTDIDPAYTGNRMTAPSPTSCTDIAQASWVKKGRTCSTENVKWACRFNKWWVNENASAQYCIQSCYDQGSGYDGFDCSGGWASVEYEGYICDVQDVVGGMVKLSKNSNCKNNLKVMQNPAIWLADASMATTTSMQFQAVFTDALILSESPSSCNLGRFIERSSRALRDNPGSPRFLMHDPRLSLVENSLESPAAAASEVCPTVAKSFLNEKSCKFASTCTPLHLQKTIFKLDTSTFQKFYDVDKKYVYEVTGLRASVSPCATLSRWERLDCNAVACSVTSSVSTEDAELIATELALEEGWLRDITAACDKKAVSAGTVVKLDNDYFKNVHLSEHGVYDFTTWVEKHPGGSNYISQWAAKGFVLVLPEWHAMDRFEAGSSQKQLDHLGRIGEEIDFRQLPTGLQTHDLARAFSAKGEANFFEACGSPGEAANDPAKGNRMSMYTRFDQTDKEKRAIDLFFEPRHTSMWQQNRLTKATVWGMKAFQANDQLRQRVAWALSQIFVIGEEGYGNAEYTEMWLNYYDNFVRNAFGNFRDVLRGVTYSTVMGEYLSFKKNRAFDSSNNYPDENYAREIMQLFTIGLWKLNADGSRVRNADSDVPTYDNEHIMNFARVFTGFDSQLARSNMEKMRGQQNKIDPMVMKATWHDTYPKPDLDGNYLGDGYPLCSDIRPLSFLSKGAKYTFVGYTFEGSDAMVPSEGSQLPAALSGCAWVGSWVSCTHSLNVELQSTIQCHDKECKMDSLRVVKVGTGYYEYVPPTCVQLYFYNGQLVKQGGKRFTWKNMCANPDLLAAGTSCCGGCTNKPTNSMKKKYQSCENATTSKPTMYTKDCKHRESWYRNTKYCQLACWQNNASYPGDDCSAGAYTDSRICGQENERVRFSVAQANCASLGQGQAVCTGRTAASNCGYEEMWVWTPETCHQEIEVRASGKVSAQTDAKAKQNEITVLWENGFPTAETCPSKCTVRAGSCVCPMSVKVEAVFNYVPTLSDMETLLSVGALVPTIACRVCSGDVMVYGASDIIDADTVFENKGRFFRNVKSTVHVEGYKFRNPPVFMVSDAPTEKAALAEVESLLDHLVQHPNTPVFIAYRLIQRLVSSNPSAAYIKDVAEAFKTGIFAGASYSGKYGDLSATVAAILLHPEAREPQTPRTQGLLREPLVKIVHFLRAMEYSDNEGRDLIFKNLEEVIGQAPYQSPTVFNFYSPNYQPPRLAGTELVSPEFEIYTPPFGIGLLNGMMSLIGGGLSSCNEGFGPSSRHCSHPDGIMGSFNVMTSKGNTVGSVTCATCVNVSGTLTELDLLLTGGRLTSKDVVKTAFETAEDGEGFKAAQKVILMTPEFNTLGKPEPLGTRPTKVETPANKNPAVYKAMVLLFMAGGADTFNMLVPFECPLYDEYVAVRKDVALAPFQLHEITTTGQACAKFAVHYKLPFIKELYNRKKAAFLSNIGSLVEPTEKYKFKKGGAKKCVGLFSHSDQVQAAQTLQCQIPGASPKGAGGRIGDALAEKYKTTSFSVAGTTTWSQGFRTFTEIIDKRHGAVRLKEFQELKTYIGNITSHRHNNVYAEEYTQQFADAMDSSEKLGAYLDNVALKTDYVAETGLAKQLHQVARLIAARQEREAERDFFFVRIGGFDTHQNLADTVYAKFEEIDNALRQFVDELEKQGIFDNTVLVSQSDFGRTLSSNGEGTDHAWAGNHFVLGGSINGGRVFNDFPKSLLLDNEQDVGRGRMIPKYPWENMMVPIANWMGLEQSQHASTFPNLANFNSSHILDQSALFVG